MSILGSRLSDLEVVMDVASLESMNTVAKLRRIQPSTVMKIIERVEADAGCQIFIRSKRGVQLTSEGRALLRLVTPLLEQARVWDERALASARDRERVITCGAPAVLATHLLPGVVADLKSRYPMTAFRILELAPGEVVTAALSGHFDLILHMELYDLPRTWSTELVGSILWRLYGNRRHPLAARGRAEMSDVFQYPFLLPTYWTRDRVVTAHDRFPMRHKIRRRGDETQTAEAALRLVESTSQLAFLPEILVAERKSDVALIKTDELPDVSVDVHVSVRADTVPAPLLKKFIESGRVKLDLS